MLKNVIKHPTLAIHILLPTTFLVVVGLWYLLSLSTTNAEVEPLVEKSTQTTSIYGDTYVMVHLDINTIVLHSGTTTETLSMVSQGKPGSYYETIGGEYTSDYKKPLHFSSIGHVYMPFSIHIFGNYFIHGIPYYPDGTKVSSAYSGGCIRLSDADAEHLYRFITPTTPIIITRGGDYDFVPTATTSASMTSMTMTDLMVATISLELLTQDNEILDVDGSSLTTRRKLLPLLLVNHDNRVSTLYAKERGEKAFVEAMNDKAKALGMTNTTFTQVTSPTFTTEEDYARFLVYISTYKSYLLTDFRN